MTPLRDRIKNVRWKPKELHIEAFKEANKLLLQEDAGILVWLRRYHQMHHGAKTENAVSNDGNEKMEKFSDVI